MKKSRIELVIFAGIFICWIPIFVSWFAPGDWVDWISIFLSSLFLTVAAYFMWLKALKNLLFKYPNGRRWIKKGNHYCDRHHPFWPNVKFFFFKKDITIAFRIDPRAYQDEPSQWNKIFGISSIIHRKNSARAVWKCARKVNHYKMANYRYLNGERAIDETDYVYKMGEYHYVTIRTPRMIWFGYYHNPYHGGESATQRTYWTDIKVIG